MDDGEGAESADVEDKIALVPLAVSLMECSTAGPELVAAAASGGGELVVVGKDSNCLSAA